jgi:hypothetical protein
MSHAIVDQLLSILDQGFERPPGGSATDGWHSLLSNLDTVRDEEWDVAPPGGKRTIVALALHCGFAMRMYADYGFGPGTLPMSGAAFPSKTAPPARSDALPWLRESYHLLRDGVASCVDADLGESRLTHWGEAKPRRWFIVTMIEHDLYHAGEINHIRALAQGNDG